MFDEIEIEECDVLVIGGGGAGAWAARCAADPSLKILLVSRGPLGRSGLTPTANGGTARLSPPEAMFKRMMSAGCRINNPNLVWYLSNQAHNALAEVEALGIRYHPIRSESVCVPSMELMSRLRRSLLETPGVDLREDVLVTRLYRDANGMNGAACLDLNTGHFFGVRAGAVVIATGGATGELWPMSSNNPFGVSTDASAGGHVLGYEIGAELVDMEMAQFVPLPVDSRFTNIRFFPDFWEGPYVNRLGDVVADNMAEYVGKSYSYDFVRKLYREIREGRGPIAIDKRGKQRPQAKSSIPSFVRRGKLFQKLQIDPYEDRVELGLGSHFNTGGLRVNEKTETTVDGLFAAGEVMGGLHGGLRLAGYSFTQIMVFGMQAGRQAAGYVQGRKSRPELSLDALSAEKRRIYQFLQPAENQTSLNELKPMLQNVMNRDVFIERNQEGVTRAIGRIHEIQEAAENLRVPGFKRQNLQWARAIEFIWLTKAAELIARSALLREESRAFHYRTDFTEQNDKSWRRHTVVVCKNEKADFWTEPIEECPEAPMVEG